MLSALRDHQTWLGYLQPDGLVVSPAALVDLGLVLDANILAHQENYREFLAAAPRDADDDEATILASLPGFLTGFLGWPEEFLLGATPDRPVPDSVALVLPEFDETILPTYAVRDPAPKPEASPWLLLVQNLPIGTDLDAVPDSRDSGWPASPARKFERLLKHTGVPTGLLCNGTSIRLLHAPKGENSGSLTFRVADMAEVGGRPILAALRLLLASSRLFTGPLETRLPALLRKSRDFQANVSTRLAGQVLDSLYDLLRGFQAADQRAKGTLFARVMADDPQQIYGGLITTLLRLVFLLYAEDRDLMPRSPLYQRNYSVQGLFQQLRADHERHPDTMDQRFGAWPRLLALFRAVHAGCRHRDFRMPARQGHLFDPDRYPFLEGRSPNQPSSFNLHTSTLPLLPDGTILRVLENLLLLDGERLSYRTLDVEQIGSVYETIMGFRIETATGTSIALKPKKSHGAPLHIDLDALLAAKPGEREKFLAETADTKLPDAAAKALKAAASTDDLLAALDKRIDRRATPRPAPAASIILQPTDERRRSGSHYTPRSFTEPIVRKTLEPILDRLGRHPRPEVILGLKVADIAVGSAAFLVETCRQLADELVSSWHFHKCLPTIPPDEDEVLFARRLVAQRCLYGVDRNPMAVDLAKLSLWLTTMAKDHPFTFVDHAIKCGDSLVGLTNKQIAAFHWDEAQAKQTVFGQDQLEYTIRTVAEYRKKILDLSEDTESAVLQKQEFLATADATAQRIKDIGDLVIAAFFAGDKPKKRQELRDEFLQKQLDIMSGRGVHLFPWKVQTLKNLGSGEHPIKPFHWELEFPEVFERENPGFDAIVGNPPFAGKNTISAGSRPGFPDWLKTVHEDSHGNADLVAHFFRRGFNLARQRGTVGLIATNTIGQGDTRSSGLRVICLNGGQIFAATRRTKWPGDAAVTVSVVWIFKGDYSGSRILDGKPIARITAYLFHAGSDDNPASLASNSGLSFQGPIPLGMGFTFDDTDTKGVSNPIQKMKELIGRDPRNAERIFPYIGGDEVLNHPRQEHHRYIISFGSLTEEEAKTWPDLYKIVEDRVKPIRITDNRESYRKYWWQFAEKRGELTELLKQRERILMHPFTASYVAFSFLPAETIISGPHNVFLLDGFEALAVLQSSCHDLWTRFFSSSLEDRQRYTTSDCFETYPFPREWETNPVLEDAGKTYYEFRANLMVRNNEGLTKTYNRFHDPEERSPDILKLRELHAAMDRAVLDAYGWTDIPTDCQFLLDYEEEDEEESEATGKKRKKKKPWRYRWPDDIRDEVLARLLALNAERHAEEVRAGIAPGMKPAKQAAAKKTAKKSAARAPATFEPLLLGLQDRPWEGAIDRLSVAIPDRSRQPSESSLAYYRLLIPAIVQEAGGSVSLNLLFTAIESLEDRERVADAVDGLVTADKKRWLSSFMEKLDSAAFGSALKGLAVDGKRIRIVGSTPDSLEVRNQLTAPVTLDWIIADARMTLKATRNLGSEDLLSPPADLVQELIHHARSA